MMALDLSADFALANDIDASETSIWNWVSAETCEGFTPIGDSSEKFAGTFDGQGHTISGLTIDRDSDYVGLFGWVETGGPIKDVTLAEVNIEGKAYRGALAGYLN